MVPGHAGRVMPIFLKCLPVWMTWSLVSDPQRWAQTGASTLTTPCFPLAALAPVPQAWRIGIIVTLFPSQIVDLALRTWLDSLRSSLLSDVFLRYHHRVSSFGTGLDQNCVRGNRNRAPGSFLYNITVSSSCLLSSPEHQRILFFPLI